MTQSPYSHYSSSRSKSAEGEFRPGRGDLYTHLTNLSGNNAINYGVSAAVPGAIAGLGGAGIGALIQALRGKSIGKGALIGGGIGGLAGAGTGVLAKFLSDAADPLGSASIRTARQIVSSTDPIETEKLKAKMRELDALR